MKQSVSKLARIICAAAVVLPLVSPRPALAYGGDGHSIVADIALLELSRSNTASDKKVIAAVNKLLNDSGAMPQLTSNSSPEDVAKVWEAAARWADDIRPPMPGRRVNAARKDALGVGFLDKIKAKFPHDKEHHTDWHFVDVPFNFRGANSRHPLYSRSNVWTKSDDLVQMLRFCAQTLHGDPSPDTSVSPVELSKPEALRLIIHYVGDLHQPLHVGCGYPIEENGMVAFKIPQGPDAENLVPKSDRGANKWFVSLKTMLPSETSPVKLHSYWDTHIINLIRRQNSKIQTARLLDAKLTPLRRKWLTLKGDYRLWSVAWANDSLRIAPQAYKGLVFHLGNSTEDEESTAELPETSARAYERQATNLTRIQLAKAGFRLAEILRATLGA